MKYDIRADIIAHLSAGREITPDHLKQWMPWFTQVHPTFAARLNEQLVKLWNCSPPLVRLAMWQKLEGMIS